jgi:aryl-alcohol dehydrogenase-like predicted oxidoreductase
LARPDCAGRRDGGRAARAGTEGKIGHVGVSNHNAAQMAEFSATLPIETLQPPYHLFRREIEEGELPYCRAHNIGVLVYGPLAHGLLTGTLSTRSAFAVDDWRSTSGVFSGETFERNLATVRALATFAADLGITVSQLAIAWTLANPAVHVAIVGARQVGHVQDSLAAADLSLSDADLDEIDKIMSSAAQVAGPSPEGM